MGNTPQEKAKLIGTAAGNLDMAATSVAFIFLSNVGGNLKNIFTTHRDVFQITAFILSAIGLAVAAARLALAPNKNLGKVQKLGAAIFQFIPAVVMLFAAATLGTVVSTALFFTVIAIDTLIAIGKAIYFGVKAAQNLSEEEKTFFKERAKKFATGAIIGALFIAAFAITIIAAPYIGVSIVAATGIVAGILAASILFFSIGKAIQQTFFKKEEKPDEENPVDLEKENEEKEENILIEDKTFEPEPTAELDAVQNPDASLIDRYWAHIATPKKIKLDDLKKAIDNHIEKINKEDREDKTHESFWSQTEKRKNKMEALGFLKELLKNSSAGIPEKITLGNEHVEYKNKEDLIKQIDQYVIKTYPDVYQSFFKKIGTVEDLFRQAYQILRDTPIKQAPQELHDTAKNEESSTKTPE